MFLLIQLLAQAQQPKPWGFLLFGLLAVAAVGLLVYFLTRVRKSEKEAEDDWGISNRGILLPPTKATATEVKKKSEPEPAAPRAAAPEPQPFEITSASGIRERQLVADSVSPSEPQATPAQPDIVEAAEIIPLPADEHSVLELQHEEPVVAA